MSLARLAWDVTPSRRAGIGKESIVATESHLERGIGYLRLSIL